MGLLLYILLCFSNSTLRPPPSPPQHAKWVALQMTLLAQPAQSVLCFKARQAQLQQDVIFAHIRTPILPTALVSCSHSLANNIII